MAEIAQMANPLIEAEVENSNQVNESNLIASLSLMKWGQSLAKSLSRWPIPHIL